MRKAAWKVLDIVALEITHWWYVLIERPRLKRRNRRLRLERERLLWEQGKWK